MLDTIFHIWIISILIISSLGVGCAFLLSFYAVWLYITEVPKPKYRSIYDEKQTVVILQHLTRKFDRYKIVLDSLVIKAYCIITIKENKI